MTALGVAHRVGQLEAADVHFRRNGERLHYNEPAGLLTEHDHEFVRRSKPEVLRLIEEWDEEAQRERLDGAFDWADRTTSPGCWAWCCRYRPDQRAAYDEVDDAICDAFQEKDTAALADALHRFGGLISSAVEAYREASPLEREQAGREYVQARACTRPSTTPEPAGASC
jgi:hypothetical protein